METDSSGNFTIKNVIPGVYRVHGWVPGFIGDYLGKELVSISAGTSISLIHLYRNLNRKNAKICCQLQWALHKHSSRIVLSQSYAY